MFGVEFGWLDVCLRVEDVKASRDFYERLGFRRVEGEDEEGWAVVVKGDARLGLFEPKYMSQQVTLNFRGGNVGQITEELTRRGFRFVEEPKTSSDGSGSAVLRDPDGHTLFFDTAPGETKKD